MTVSQFRKRCAVFTHRYNFKSLREATKFYLRRRVFRFHKEASIISMLEKDTVAVAIYMKVVTIVIIFEKEIMTLVKHVKIVTTMFKTLCV